MSSEDGGMVEILDSNGNGQNATDTPKRNTTSLELSPDEIEKAEIARNQLLNLTKKSAKKKSSPVTSDNEHGVQKAKPEVVSSVISTITPSNKPAESFTEIIYDGKPTMGNLSSAIISKEELEDEIRKKIAIKGEKRKSYDIEIPQELILSEVAVQPSTSKDEQSQLDGQELIDILEGNGDAESDTYEVISDNGVFVVKAADQETSYEIVSPEEQIKKKVIERQIAMQQIASMPVRRNKRSNPTPVATKTSPAPRSAQPSLAQSLAMDWSDKEEEVILEVENIQESNEPKIKILNMTILNESAPEPKTVKPEPKILNINAPSASPPKILNKMAPQVKPTEPASFKRSRVVKKKQIWDPSESPQALPTEKKPEKIPIALPSTITIKKVTKETIAKEQPVATKSTPSPARKGKKKSEIEKLFQDEGAVNMIYSLERQNNNQDVPELNVFATDAFVDKSEEKSTLIAKQKTIRDTIIKQSTSPNEAKNISTRPQRVKRDLTPSKPVEPPKLIEKTPEKTVTVIKAQKVTPASRKKKIDDSWDFVRNAQTTCEDAMIIRRHSNSSYSSSAPTSPRRLSVEQSMNDSGENFKMPKDRKSTDAPKDLKTSVGGLVEELRNTLSTKLAKGKTPPAARGRKRAAATTHENAKKRNLGSEFNLTKADGVAHIVVSSEVFTLSLLESIKSTLTQLEDDSTCKIVLFTASEGFSKGLDYSSLVQSTVDKRKQAASDLVTAVKNFFMSLAVFPKTLICGLKGLTSGIGVSMLPLFDIVIADQTAKFSLPHVQIGSNPEGISILQASNKINSSVITQQFFLHETLDAKTALQSGLISKIVTGNIDVQLREICKQISSHSSQAMESTKKLLNEDFLDTIDHRLTKEVKILQTQWISAECQEKFKKMSA